MELKEVILELMANNVRESVAFYRDLLGFELLATEEKDGYMEWAKMKLGDFLLSFKDVQKVRNELSELEDKDPGGTVSICFQVKNIREFYKNLETNPMLLKALHISPCGMTEFTIKDNNGYLLTFDELEN